MRTVEQSTAAAAPPARQELRFGYNHNFRHKGRLFHVQTEDSGPERCHIYSHIFFAGTVIASSKTEYNQHNHRASRRDIQAMMQRSHRKMCIALRDGRCDERIAALTSRPATVRRHRSNTEIPAAACAPQPSRPPTPQPRLCEPPLFDDYGPAELEALRKCLVAVETGVTGFLGAAVVNQKNGTTVRALGSAVDMKTAISGNLELLHSKMRLLEQLDLDGTLEDILISLEKWFCILRPLGDALFLYVILDRAQGNLAMARHVVSTAGSCLAP